MFIRHNLPIPVYMVVILQETLYSCLTFIDNDKSLVNLHLFSFNDVCGDALVVNGMLKVRGVEVVGAWVGASCLGRCRTKPTDLVD